MKNKSFNTLYVFFALALVLSMVGGEVQAEIPKCENIGEIDYYPAPNDLASLHGIAFDGKYLWASNYGAGQVHKMGFDDSGNIITLATMKTPTNHPTGLTFIGKKLAVATDERVAIATDEGGEGKLIVSIISTQKKKFAEVVKSFVAPGEDSVGLAYDGDFLYNADWVWSNPDVAAVHKLTPNGTLVATYWGWKYPEGLAYDGQDLWLTELDQNKIYKLDSTDLSEICYFDGPGSAPIGLTFANGSLWLADQETQTFYKIDIGL